ncbi:MAG: hypothetical protein ACI9UA_005458, partial [Pseudoalteromonas tetraodonis]
GHLRKLFDPQCHQASSDQQFPSRRKQFLMPL